MWVWGHPSCLRPEAPIRAAQGGDWAGLGSQCEHSQPVGSPFNPWAATRKVLQVKASTPRSALIMLDTDALRGSKQTLQSQPQSLQILQPQQKPNFIRALSVPPLALLTRH